MKGFAHQFSSLKWIIVLFTIFEQDILAVSPLSCPGGSYVSSGICLECPAGHFCIGNVTAPRRCPVGTYNIHPGKGNFLDCQTCPAGLISTLDGVDCKMCPTGYSCNSTTGALTLCKAGRYSPEGHTDCIPCPPGFACSEGFLWKCGPGEEPSAAQSECTSCAAGSYSTVFSSQCHPCPVGSYCPKERMAQPWPCPPGHHNLLPGQLQCQRCNGSFSCDGTRNPVWTGTGGQLGPRTRPLHPCPPGTYRIGEEVTACMVCPLGYYCIGGVAIQCPAGTYGAKEGLQREKDCTFCPAGFYCLEGSTRRPSTQFLCPVGFYCEEGTAVPHGSPCPAGTAGGQMGQTSRAACKRCVEGRYCPPGSVGQGLPCARGKFCPAGTLTEILCPQGTFTAHEGAQSIKDCLKCPVGFYCPEGTSNPVPCPAGTFNPLEGQYSSSDCRTCYPGKACTHVALKSPDVDCMPGYVCPPGSDRPNAPENACPPGTLSNRTDLTDPSQCQQCPVRYACLRGTGGIQRPPLSCFPGHYCPAGTMFPTQHSCPPGTWSERSGLEAESECQLCPKGWYCLAGAGAPSGRCSSGHYCPEGTTYGSQFPCPAGTYSPRMGNGQRADCVICPEGSYCEAGTSKPSPCHPSTFRKTKGGMRVEDCSVCPAGYFCPDYATNIPKVCGAGSFSDEASVECLPCLPGHYCSNQTTSAEVMLRVMVCPAGFVCAQGLDREPQQSAVLCPVGFYCPGGSIVSKH
ncbi:multiple epidermal growth factor-like domains protein 6 [Denticeps clupeoides]|uniref:multiple epidermal growth factor-like domains protein 6 n=1 Tax=Denticeps clupeoides TaxID=299321 RepID=UPI0010A47657|nr:multiple epidermal growth factor-like domains protein 6 [Denticeps clupeoides]